MWQALQSQTDQEVFEAGVGAGPQPQGLGLRASTSAVQLAERTRLDSSQHSAPSAKRPARAMGQGVNQGIGHMERQPLIPQGHEDSASEGMLLPGPAQRQGFGLQGVGSEAGGARGGAAASGSGAAAAAVAPPPAAERLRPGRHPFGRAYADPRDAESGPRASADGAADSGRVPPAELRPAIQQPADGQASSSAEAGSSAQGGGAPPGGVSAPGRAQSGILEDGMGHDRLAIRVRPPEKAAAAAASQGRAGAASATAGTSAAAGDNSPILT